MKKKNFLLVIALLFVMLSTVQRVTAQTIWGTLPDAFFHSSTSGEYGEAFKDEYIGSDPGFSLFISPDNTLYSVTEDAKTIYRYKAGDLRPSIVFRSDSIVLRINFIDFDEGYI